MSRTSSCVGAVTRQKSSRSWLGWAAVLGIVVVVIPGVFGSVTHWRHHPDHHSRVVTILGILVSPFLGPRAGLQPQSFAIVLGGEFGNELRYVAVIGASIVAALVRRRSRLVSAQVAAVVSVLAAMLLVWTLALVTVTLHDSAKSPPPKSDECSFHSENSQGGT